MKTLVTERRANYFHHRIIHSMNKSKPPHCNQCCTVCARKANWLCVCVSWSAILKSLTLLSFGTLGHNHSQQPYPGNDDGWISACEYVIILPFIQPKARVLFCSCALQLIYCMTEWSDFGIYNYTISYLQTLTGSWSHKTWTIKMSCVLPQDILCELMRYYQAHAPRRFIPKPCLPEINTTK